MLDVRGGEALERLLDCADVRRVLDIGSGNGEHASLMRSRGRIVTTVSMRPPANVINDYNKTIFDTAFDGIWACHVLEHQPNVNIFLRKCFYDLRNDGLLAVTVPPLKHAIVGGHLTLWNAGLLLYNLIIAGFDCSKARVSGCYAGGSGKGAYNISVLVRKRAADLPPLDYDAGEIEKIAHFFPLPVGHGFNGQLAPINW